MRKKSRYLLIAGLFACMHTHAQQLSPGELLRIFSVSPKGSLAKDGTETFIYPAYAVEGPLPSGTLLRRRLSDQLSIVSLIPATARQSLQQHASRLIPVNHRWKLSPALLQASPVKEPSQDLSIILAVSDIGLFEKTYQGTKEVQVKASYPATGSVLVQATASWIERTALADDDINFIAAANRALPERELTGFDLSANQVNMAHRSWPALGGHGLTVSIKENKMDTTDIDLRGRYLPSAAASAIVQTHATTMATIAAGGGNTFYTGKGVAWRASLSSSDFANLLPDNIQELQRLQVSVQNHSYGVGIENYYGADAAAYDAQSHQHPTLLHVFSAGNMGTATSATGAYSGISGYANLTGSFKMAKNILTVGATDSFGTVPALSSRGPAFDGRLKPELVALGEDGSSGAAAIVSGTSLLLQDAWKQKHGQYPIAAVTRSILLNSATDVGARGIDFVSGYGSVNAYRSVQTVMQDHVFTGSVAQGQVATHTLAIPAQARNLKITVCWTDPAAQANSFKALVNDLDLRLQHMPSTQQWLPWVLNSHPQKDSLQQLPVRRRDSLNTAEQITLETLVAGNYLLTVHGFSVTGTPQPYAIAWQYDTSEHFVFTYPVKNDNLFPGQTHTIRWETTLAGTGTIQYRIDTASWQDAATGVDLARQYAQWTAPAVTAALQLRMLVNGKEWRTDTVGISSHLRTGTGFNCADSFLLYWQHAAVDSYHVYRLGPQYLERFITLADTTLRQFKQNNPYQYFTVAPVLRWGTEGARAYTFDYTQQQVGCYINSFIADPSGIDKARLSLELGTIFGVARIVFEKLGANGFVAVDSVSPVVSRQQIRLLAAGKGLNTYRARVELSDGRRYYTKPEQALIFAGQTYYVFPNPLRQGASLSLLAEETDNTFFALYDLFGRKVAEQRLDGLFNTIRLPLLQKGLYYYTIRKDGVQQLSHSLMVL